MKLISAYSTANLQIQHGDLSISKISEQKVAMHRVRISKTHVASKLVDFRCS